MARKPSGKMFLFFLSLCWSNREGQVAFLWAQTQHPAWGSRGLSPADALPMSAQHHSCSQFTWTKSRKCHRNATLKASKQTNKPCYMAELKAANQERWGGKEEGRWCALAQARQGDTAELSGIVTLWHAERPLHLRSNTRSPKALNQNRAEASHQGQCRQSSQEKHSIFRDCSCWRGLPGSPQVLTMELWDGAPKLPELQSTLGK